MKGCNILSPRLPHEIFSQIIYQYVLSIPFKHVLQLRLVSPFFDLETIRVLLDTIDYRPPIHIKWYPLTHHYFRHCFRNASGTGSSIFDYRKPGVDELKARFPDRIDVDICYDRLANFYTFCKPIHAVLYQMRARVSEDTWPNDEALFMATIYDDITVLEHIWLSIEESRREDIIGGAIDLSCIMGNIHTLRWLLSTPEALHTWHNDPSGKQVLAPLKVAARYGRLEIVKMFAEQWRMYTPDPSAEFRDAANEAAEWGHVHVVEYLTQEIDKSGTRYLPSPPQLWFNTASRHGHVNLLRALTGKDGLEVSTGMNMNWFRSTSGLRTALEVACTHGQIKSAKCILDMEASACHLDLQSEWWRIFLAKVVAKGDLEFCQLLVRAGMKWDWAHLDVAVEHGQTAILKWFHDISYAPPDRPVSALAFARAVARGYPTAVAYVLDTNLVNLDSCTFDDFDLTSEEMVDGVPRVSCYDIYTTARVNDQQAMLDMLLRRGDDRLYPNDDEGGVPDMERRLANGSFPIRDPFGCILAYEDAEMGTNVQIWGRKVPKSQEVRLRSGRRGGRRQAEMRLGRGAFSHMAPAF